MTRSNSKPGTISKPIEDLHTVVINGKAHWFACLVTAQTERLAELDRQLRALCGERERVAIELQHLRGLRAYAEITANDNRLDEVDE